jgi:predicted nucleic acid-binding protein
MMSTKPLLVFDTNILMDILLGRNGDAAVLLVKLAEQGVVELAIPEYVLFEFRGTALRWIGSERERLVGVRQAANEWSRSQELNGPAEEISSAARRVAAALDQLAPEVDIVLTRMRKVAKVQEHTQEIHFQGDLRFLQGLPPDRPGHGIEDCRIYEAVLEVARSERETSRSKYFVTCDADFVYPALQAELTSLGFAIRSDPGKLYGELRVS